MSEQLRGQLLQIGFGRFEGLHASGTQANNKLELGYETLRRYPEVLDRIVTGLCETVVPYRPDFVAGVPHGATSLATEVGKQLDTYEVRLTKSAGTITYAHEQDKENLRCVGDGVLIEDVLNRLTNTKACLDLPGLGAKVVAVAGIFDRGFLGQREPIEQPIHSLVSLPIGTQLPDDHYLFRRYAS